MGQVRKNPEVNWACWSRPVTPDIQLTESRGSQFTFCLDYVVRARLTRTIWWGLVSKSKVKKRAEDVTQLWIIDLVYVTLGSLPSTNATAEAERTETERLTLGS